VEERGYHAFIEFLLRKGAHVVTFGALAIATYIMVRRIGIAFILTVILAIADEYHQSLTGGRTPTVHDVMLDSFGAAMALLVVVIVKAFLKRKADTKNPSTLNS
jgi:VanZ family protein